MKCTIEFQMDNAAFEDNSGAEAARILRELADEVEHYEVEIGIDGTVHDINGNVIGKIFVR